MMEEMATLKCYLRALMRLIKEIKVAMENKDYERAEKLLDELIDDTQKNIED